VPDRERLWPERVADAPINADERKIATGVRPMIPASSGVAAWR